MLAVLALGVGACSQTPAPRLADPTPSPTPTTSPVRVAPTPTLPIRLPTPPARVITPPRTELVSFARSGKQSGNNFAEGASISYDGRYVAFFSGASDLVPGDTNKANDVFVRDLQTHRTVRVSVSSSGAQGTRGGSQDPAISGDGRYVAFTSGAPDLVRGDTNGTADVFVHDMRKGTTVRASVSSNGEQADKGGDFPAISADGSRVTFASYATDLVANDTNDHCDVFVRNMKTGTTELVSKSSSGVFGNSDSFHPSISGDGNWAVFHSESTNLVLGQAPDDHGAIFTHDLRTSETARLPAPDGDDPNASYYGTYPHLSFDGGVVQYAGAIFDRTKQTYLHLTSAASGRRVDTGATAVSPDGRWFGFGSDDKIFVFDSQTRTLWLVTLYTNGKPGRGTGTEDGGPSIARNGTAVAFDSPDRLDPRDKEGQGYRFTDPEAFSLNVDVYVRHKPAAK